MAMSRKEWSKEGLGVMGEGKCSVRLGLGRLLRWGEWLIRDWSKVRKCGYLEKCVSGISHSKCKGPEGRAYLRPEGEWKSRRPEVRGGATRGHPQPPSRGILCMTKHSLGMWCLIHINGSIFIHSLLCPVFFLLHSIPWKSIPRSFS